MSVLVWDMLNYLPIGYDIPWAVHAAGFPNGVALLDNALLEPLAKACVDEGGDEFMLLSTPLRLVGSAPTRPPARWRSSSRHRRHRTDGRTRF